MVNWLNGILILVSVASSGSLFASLDSLRNEILKGELRGGVIISYAKEVDLLSGTQNQIKEFQFLIDQLDCDHSDALGYLKAAKAEYLFEAGLYDSAGVNFSGALKTMGEDVQDSTLRSGVFNKVGVFYNRRGNLDSAIYYYERAEEQLNKSNKSSLAGILNNKSNAYVSKGYYETAIDLLNKAFRLFVSLDDTQNTALTLMNLGDLYFQSDEPDKAVENQLRAIALFKSVNDSLNLSKAYTNLSNGYQELNKLDSARFYALESMEIKNKYGQESSALISLHSLARVECAEGNYGLAYQLADSLHEKSRVMGIMPGVYYGLFLMVQSKHKMGQYKESISLTHDLLAFLKEKPVFASKPDIHKVSMENYRAIEKYDSALYHYEKYVNITDSINRAKRKSRVDELKVMFETEQKELENQKLKNKALIKEADTERTKNVQIVLVIGIVVLFGFVAVLYRYNSVKSKVNKSLKSINETQKQQNLELQRVNAVKDKLFSIIGHDLRGPANSLVTALGMVNSVELKEQEKADLLLELEEQAISNNNLITNVMHWATAQKEGAAPNPEAVRAQDCINENIKLFKTQARRKDIKIVNDVESDLTVYADKNLLDIVFRNLISNAVKFTSRNGTISLRALQKGDEVIFCVEDNGKGMSEKLKNSLFKSRFSTDGTHMEKGSGLGLFLCKEAVEKSGGKIWVESEQDKGTTFCFTLPHPASLREEKATPQP